MSSDVAIPVLLAESRVTYCPCRAENFRAFHFVGSSECLVQNCSQHYGFCAPASVDIVDLEENIGIVTLDTEALKQFLAARRPLPSCEPSTSPSTSTLSRATSLPPYHFQSTPVAQPVSSSSRAPQNPDPCPPRRSSLNVVHTWTPLPSQAALARNQSDSELAATGRRGGGASPSSSHFDSSHHAFSQLMQTDDVSSIAEQIASQAELIYQTWKTTGLNPNQLIRYHSIATEDDVDSAPARCVTPVPRTPMRSISPAPPGSSPAVPRRVLDPSMTNGRQQQQQAQQQQFSSKQMQQSNSYQQLHQQPEKHRKDTPYIQQHYTQQFPSSQTQQQQQHYPNQQVQHLQNQSQHSSSPVRTLNASPRPYVSPNSPQSQGQAPFRSASPSPSNVGYLHSNSPRPFVSSPPVSPPQPPERSSSYSGSDSPGENRQVLSDPKVEVSLRDLVNTFVLEDKARQGLGTRLNERPKSAPSTIQDALQRFERQMAITSRSTPPLNDERLHDASVTSNPMSPQYSPDGYSTSSPFSSSNSAMTRYASGNSGNSSETLSKRYTGSRSEPSVTDGWQKSNSSNNPELDFRSRRSISPSPPPLAQPGWNETSQSSTSTWPLKFKQPSPGPQSSSSYAPSSVSVSPPKNNPSTSSSNYVTTLETRVEGPGSSASVPSRHKIINLGPPTQEERILQSLRSSSLIQESEQKRLAGQQSSRPSSNSSASTYSTSSTVNSPKQKPKFSISVTVDVDEAKRPDTDTSSYRIRPEVSQMSTIDYAKVRFQEAQQHPKTAVRLQDERNIAGPRNPTVNGDGRVLSVKNRFEPGEAMLRSFDPVLSTLPEFYRRKLRKMQRKSGSPEPLAGVLATLPHPELTDQQKAHIRERSQSPTAAAFHAAAGAAAIRPFLTQGSVAERVMIFERAPVEMKPKPPSEISHLPQERRRPVLPYRDPDSVRSKAQFWNILHFLAELDNLPPSEETLSPPPSGGISPAIAAAASTVSRHIEGSVPALPAPNEPRHQTYVRDPNLQDKPQTVFKASQSASGSTNGSSSSSAASSSVTAVLHNKENTRPGANVTSSLQHKSATPLTGSVFSTSSTSSGSSGAFGSTPSSPPHVPAAQPAVGRPSAPPTARRLAKTTSKNIIIPKFYFPQGRPSTPAQQEASIQRMASCFRDHGGQITKDQLDVLMRACDLPLYWKAPVFVAAGGEKLGYLTQELFTDYWSRVLSTCHDEASRFIHVLSRGTRNYILPEDFVGLIQDVVDSHPGLAFLKDAAEFHSRYVHTVIARIYYCVNRSWSGKITAAELRRSNLLSVISYLEDEEDINQITEYFSYEHFYVIYCKFWELDTDHDLFIDKNDLAKHNERALSMPIIERIFSGAVTRGRVQKQERMGYQEFVWFLISEEDKRHPTAIEYWFRCMDIDGDGFLSMYELEYFYEEQLQRMEALGIETLPFHDCLCQMLDMVRPEYPNKISLTDLKRCRMTPIFFDTFFNLEKYLDHEQRDPFASHRADDDGPEISDWDRFAAEEYELLVAEEGGTDAQDDLMYGAEDELSAGLEAVLARGDGVEGVGGEACTDSHAGSTSKQAGRSGMGGGALSKHSSLSATLTNLAVDAMDVDDDYADYADSDDYHY